MEERKMEMSDEMKNKMKMAMDKIGLPEKTQTEGMMWAMKKAIWSGSGLMQKMTEGGISEDKAMDYMKNFSDMMMDKEMMQEMKESMESDWKKKSEM